MPIFENTTNLLQIGENMSEKVFISYSWDTEEHKEQVLSFANELVHKGVDVILDRYEEAPTKGWPIWMEDSIEEAKFVLIVFTKKYLQRFSKKEPVNGRGAIFEGAIITQDIYDANGCNEKFIPIIMSPNDEQYIAKILRAYTVYRIYDNQDYTKLYARLTGQRFIEKPKLGKIVPIDKNVLLNNSLPEFKIDSVDELVKFVSELNIDSLSDDIQIGLSKGSRTQRQEEILNFRFFSLNQSPINIIINENIEGQYEIRVIANSSFINGKQVNLLASELIQKLEHSVSNLQLVSSDRNDICNGTILRYIITYDN